jgi:hypothetical protein
MVNREGYINDLPKKKGGEGDEEEPKIDSGFAGNISMPEGPRNTMPGVGHSKGRGESKYLKQFHDTLKAEEAEKEKKNKKKNSPK